MPRPPAHNQRNVLLLSGVGQLSTRWFELMFPTLAVSLAAAHGTRIGEVLSWSFLGYLCLGLGALPAGWLADRLSGRRLLLVAMFGLGVASLAASEADSPRALSLCLAAMGLCAGVASPIGRRLLARSGDAAGRAGGVQRLLVHLAVALTPAITAALCARIGWQDTFRAAGYAICGLAVGGAFLRVDERRLAAPPAPRTGQRGARGAALLLIGATMAGIGYRGALLIQPAYFAAHASVFPYGVATSLVYAVGIAGVYLGERPARRHDLGRRAVMLYAFGVLALLAMAGLEGWPLLAAAAAYLVVGRALQPIERDLFTQHLPERWRTSVDVLQWACAVGLGALGVWLVDWADARGGMAFVLVCVAAAVGVAGSIIALLRWRPAPSESTSEEQRAVPGELLPAAVLAASPVTAERRSSR